MNILFIIYIFVYNKLLTYLGLYRIIFSKVCVIKVIVGMTLFSMTNLTRKIILIYYMPFASFHSKTKIRSDSIEYSIH